MTLGFKEWLQNPLGPFLGKSNPTVVLKMCWVLMVTGVSTWGVELHLTRVVQGANNRDGFTIEEVGVVYYWTTQGDS